MHDLLNRKEGMVLRRGDFAPGPCRLELLHDALGDRPALLQNAGLISQIGTWRIGGNLRQSLDVHRDVLAKAPTHLREEPRKS